MAVLFIKTNKININDTYSHPIMWLLDRIILTIFIIIIGIIHSYHYSYHYHHYCHYVHEHHRIVILLVIRPQVRIHSTPEIIFQWLEASGLITCMQDGQIMSRIIFHFIVKPKLNQFDIEWGDIWQHKYQRITHKYVHAHARAHAQTHKYYESMRIL